jgi:UDP-N-acetylglucosamine--N-acetylmuramyl-(pentapeptide) pyrophosphoryl-undecaprenol N-acetylglucosamine transferase
MKRVMVVAGGTGGHIYPALAIADCLAARGVEILWVGSLGRMEEKIVPEFYPIKYINIKALRGSGLRQKLLAPFRIIHATIQARALIKSFKPDVLVTMGGFVCGPCGLAAKWCSVPLVIHEQNAVAGLTNRLLARMAGAVLQAFPGAFSKNIAAQTVGNPVRQCLLNVVPPKLRMAAHNGAPRLLVLGGSQGARFINQKVCEYLKEKPADERPQVWHQTGAADFESVSQVYADFGEKLHADAFIKDMALAYAWADVVLCRAGALTVCELAAVGIASILVPFPAAVDDHQRYNAAYLVDAGAGILLLQSDYEHESFCTLLDGLLQDKDTLLAMGERAKEQAMTHAAEDVVAVCEKIGLSR